MFVQPLPYSAGLDREYSATLLRLLSVLPDGCPLFWCVTRSRWSLTRPRGRSCAFVARDGALHPASRSVSTSSVQTIAAA